MLILLLIFSACGYVDEDGVIMPCSEENQELLDKVQNDDLVALKAYIDSGGDPEFRCASGEGSHWGALFPGQPSLASAVMLSDNYDIVEYYLTLTLSQETKDDLLVHFMSPEADNITQLLIDSDAHYSSSCIALDTVFFGSLLNQSYEIDMIDSEYGNSLFLGYCECPCPDGADEIIKSMRYLIRKGADHTKTNKAGKSKVDLVENQEIKKYLQTL